MVLVLSRLNWQNLYQNLRNLLLNLELCPGLFERILFNQFELHLQGFIPQVSRYNISLIKDLTGQNTVILEREKFTCR